MVLRAVLLDVGNTLVRESPSRFAIYAEAARSRGIDVDEGRMNALMRRAHAELPREVNGGFRYSDPWFERYIERIFHDELGVPRDELAPLATKLFARFSDPATFELFDDALALIDTLRARGLKVGIVSNWSARLPRLLEDLRIAERVEFVVCSAIERLEKPDAAIFARALERAGVRADEALHAGDDLEKDVLGARRAGLRSVLVDHARRADPGHAPRATSLRELLEIVERLA